MLDIEALRSVAVIGLHLTVRLKRPTLKWGNPLVSPMTITVKSRTPLVVPPAVRRQAGLKSGDRLEFKVSGRVITILPKPLAADDEYTAAERRAIDHGIAQSEKQYAAGKSYGPFETADEAIASLNANLHRRSAAAKKLKSVSR